MGFKFKKKNTGEVSPKKESALAKKLQPQIDQYARVFGDTDKSKPLLIAAVAALLIATLSLLSLFYTVPHSNSLTQSLGDLRLLSQTVSRQATEATASGTKESIDKLKSLQAEFNRNLDVVKSGNSSSAELQAVENDWAKVSKNIDLIVSQQKFINTLYDTNIAIGEAIPGIQAEYNLMVDQMARQNLSSTQVIIAKNQVFLAERILRSISSVLVGVENSRETADDFSVDTETFGLYLNAQLNGSAELGVQRIENADLRASLESIQADYENVLKSAAAVVLKNSEQIVQVRKASSEIFAKSDELLKNLNQVSSGSGLYIVVPAIVLILALIAFLVVVYKLLTLRGDADKQRVTRLQDEYDRNQNAILRLLDEIADLADGDLRSYATVSEDFTGAIADSINFAKRVISSCSFTMVLICSEDVFQTFSTFSSSFVLE